MIPKQLILSAVQARKPSMVASAAVTLRGQSTVASAARVISDDIHDGPSTTVDGTAVTSSSSSTSSSSRLQAVGHDMTATGGCPMAAVFQVKTQTSATKRTTENGSEPKSMDKLDGPFGWPIVGNFLTYLKKENQGKMHEVQVSQSYLLTDSSRDRRLVWLESGRKKMFMKFWQTIN